MPLLATNADLNQQNPTKPVHTLLAFFDYDLGERRATYLIIKHEAALNSLSTQSCL